MNDERYTPEQQHAALKGAWTDGWTVGSLQMVARWAVALRARKGQPITKELVAEIALRIGLPPSADEVQKCEEFLKGMGAGGNGMAEA